ncbi:MAG: response regulator [Flavobacteriaceae bacterium]|nr:response regulator [Flavobacteriaceae bacterium]|tara:strand:+ start:315 stop:1478 length:1164 start_codon:yes stop_codon:yes gene_type:complete
MKKILIIEDEEPIRRVLKRILTDENPEFKISEAIDGNDAIDKLSRDKFDLAVCDIKMPKKDGLDVLKFAIKKDLPTPFIMLTGHGNIETAVDSMKIGAYDFIEKPPDLNRLLISVRNAFKIRNLQNENSRLKKKLVKKHEMIGSSSKFKNVLQLIEKVSPTNARILITGENGTGKEMVAQQIHFKSLRNQKPLIEVNCAAIPSELIESELFGHVKGSFTSAIKDRVGKFELANGGTLFLDEIGDLSLKAQAKVLRVLQEGKIQKVGSEKEIEVDVRIIAATNKKINKLIESNNFREDLFHRLAVIEIKLPTLSERKSDIKSLCDYFVEQISEEQGISKKKISKEAINTLENYPWSGNIRELRNVIERLMILGDNPISIENIKTYAPK